MNDPKENEEFNEALSNKELKDVSGGVALALSGWTSESWWYLKYRAQAPSPDKS